MKKIILVRYGEIFLKGLNRPYFISMLVERIKQALDNYELKIWYEDSRIYVSDFLESDIDDIVYHISKVFGVHSLSIVTEIEDRNIDVICNVASDIMSNMKGTFKVESKRSDKRYPMQTPDINAYVGGYILEHNSNLKVNVHNPDHFLYIEVRKHAYVYTDTIPATGGMPVGTNGKATMLLSGGIDSPVAAWMIAKRGVEINAVHFYSPPYTSERALQKVLDLAKILSESLCGVRVHVIPFTEIQLQIHQTCQDDLTTLIMRRFMMRIAECVSKEENSLGLVTGESIGQVASQTMHALACTDDAVKLPVYRPLIGFDKQDIISLAEKIGTFETSSMPYEDCCTVFTPKHPKTRPTLNYVVKEERKLDVDGLIKEALSKYKIYEFDNHGNLTIHEAINC